VVSDRVRAAWIDVVLLALLGVLVSLVAGQGHVGHWTSYDNGFPTDHHGVQINLRGGWFVVWCVMALLYYSTLEAWFGQTIGKALTGVYVVDLNGGAPSGKAVVLRTAGRIIDVLPVFYLFGWFVMNSGQGPRQRLGDRLAGTTVIGDRPLPPGRY
jgi:uncharacterized RDD family membrane protein YckC